MVFFRVKVIGVSLKFVESGIVEEFFQLFKTPWEFVRQGKSYDVIISDEEDATLRSAKLVIILEGKKCPTEREESVYGTAVDSLETKNTSFPAYCDVICVKGGEAVVLRKKGNKAVASRSEECGKVVLRMGYNFFNEMRYLLERGQPAEFAEVPTLDIHIRNLRQWILEAGVGLVEIPPVPAGGNFFVCLTHDVDNAGIKYHNMDHTLAGFLYRAVILSTVRYFKGEYSFAMLARNFKAAVSLPLIHLGMIHDFWFTFKEYIKIEKNKPSTFFFVPFKGKYGKTQDGIAPRIRAVKYEVSDLKGDIISILDLGGDIGVHGIDSWIDEEAGREEFNKIQKLTGQSEIGVRMHWLYFSPNSPVILENAGYSYDATSGYNDCIGFKAGTLQAFKPLNVKNLLQLPMHVMDTALFYPDRMDLNASKGLRAIKECVKKAVELGGVLTLNWHDRSIAPERLWGFIYEKALKELQLQGARFLSAGITVGWFRKRRAIRFERVISNDSSIKVLLKSPSIEPSDGFLLRVYLAQPGQKDLQYRDIPIWGENAIEVSV